MNPLVRLFPRAWRDRYGDELTSILEERPPGPAEVLDLLRGALDAHLRTHPTPAGPGRDVRDVRTVPHRRPVHRGALVLMGIVALGLNYAMAVSIVSAMTPDPWLWPFALLAACGTAAPWLVRRRRASAAER